MTREKGAHGMGGPQAESERLLADRDVAALRRTLLAWYRRARRDLPWRRTRDPYAIWVSEIMLQQTRVETVIPYYARFIAAFPSVHALAEAAPDAVMRAWAGLGYYRRARLMHEGARQLRDAETSTLPRTREELLRVRGIGPYTAAAIASIAFGEPVGLVDGNVARVLSRLFAIEHDMKGTGARVAAALADRLVAPRAAGDFNQAVMELGATVCLPRGARCGACPLSSACRALAEGRVDDLPRAAARAPVRRLPMRALVASSPDAVLLGRRRAGSLFGGMWEPPCVVAEDALAWPSSLSVTRDVALVHHVLTHRRLEIAVDVATASRRLLSRAAASLAESLGSTHDAVRAVRSDEARALGLTTLARKVLAAGGRDHCV